MFDAASGLADDPGGHGCRSGGRAAICEMRVKIESEYRHATRRSLA